MSPHKIDLDRGVFQRKCPDGTLISMYRDEPGTYRFLSGEEAPHEIARKAGFPVEADLIQKRKAELLEESRRKIEAQFADAEAEAEEQATAEAKKVDWIGWKGEGANTVTVRSKAGENAGEPRETERLKMEHFGGGQWNVRDKADNSIIATKVSREEAMEKLREGVQ